MGLSAACRCLDLRLGSAGAAISDVLGYGTVQQRGVLRYDADRAPQAVLRQFADIMPVYPDRALLDLVKTQQKVD